MPLATLSAAEVHLHLARPETIDEPTLEGLRALLSTDELARCARLPHAPARRAAIVTRALVRLTLSRHTDVAPDAWRFRAGAHGRPEVAGDDHGLRFNVTHTDGVIACAVSRATTLGVDVEKVGARSIVDAMTVAERFFAPAEVAALRSLSGDELQERFTAIWTLKEAYAKARGLGLGLPLDSYAFSLDDEGSARLALGEGGGDPAGWSFARLSLGPHRFAVALWLDPPGRRPLVRVVADPLAMDRTPAPR